MSAFCLINQIVNMNDTKGTKNKSPTAFHPRNLHTGRYDLVLLSQAQPQLKSFISIKANGDETIDFNNPKAVLALNQALLAHFYQIKFWDIPPGFLCPPIPGRVDYIHYSADLIAGSNQGSISREKSISEKKVRVLDIGCGANCIYPIIGSRIYGWRFVGSDIDPVSVACAQQIVKSNPNLKKHITIVHQQKSASIFKGVIGPDDYFDITMCNPPFYASSAEAQENNQRKQKNLQANRVKRSNNSRVRTTLPGEPVELFKSDRRDADINIADRNFGGQQTELWCAGGERRFLSNMVKESQVFSEQVNWFTTLVSKKDNVKVIKHLLSQSNAKQVKVIRMHQGNKITRLIAWSFSVKP